MVIPTSFFHFTKCFFPYLYFSPSELAARLLSYSRHIANGMSYLSEKKFVHRDLAARNVLMTKDEVCKVICSFCSLAIEAVMDKKY